MEDKICVYTCITGDYDDLHEIETADQGIDYLCFTNNKKLTSKTWNIIYIDNDGLDNHHLSRKIKMLGHPIISQNYDTSIWMDASVTWQKSIANFAKIYCKDKPFSAIKHSQRHSIREEAIACLKIHKDTKRSILQTLSFLKTEKFPDNLGLYEMTIFIKKHNDPIVIKAMNLWYKMNQVYSKRDQLSFMYAAWKTNLPIQPIPINIWDNNWFIVDSHKPKTSSPSLSVYFGNPTSNFNFDKFYNLPANTNKHPFTISSKIPNNCNQIVIYLSNISGLTCDNISIIHPIERYDLINATQYHENHHVFLSPNGSIILHGDFKQNQKLHLSLNFKLIDFNELLTYTEKLCIANRKLVKYQSQNNDLKTEIKSLKNTNGILANDIKKLTTELNAHTQALKDIYASKSWQIIRRIRQPFPSSKHTTINGDNI